MTMQYMTKWGLFIGSEDEYKSFVDHMSGNKTETPDPVSEEKPAEESVPKTPAKRTTTRKTTAKK